MKLLIDIDLANDAFDGQHGIESARILRKLADKLEGVEIGVPELLAALYDLNGNCVGACETRSK
jgi:hypothetical protein